MSMSMIIATVTIAEAPVLYKDKVIVKQKRANGYIKTWFCEPMTKEQFAQFLNDISSNSVIELRLKGERT